MPEAYANLTPDLFNDTYLNMELAIPIDGYGSEFSKVTKSLRDKDRLTIGISHNNIILDTIIYKVEYKDNQKYLIADNAIAESMFAQVNGEGNVTSCSRILLDIATTVLD